MGVGGGLRLIKCKSCSTMFLYMCVCVYCQQIFFLISYISNDISRHLKKI